LTRIESSAFSYSPLQSVVIPRNVELVDIIPNWAELHSRENFAESALKVNGVPSEFAAPKVLSGGKLTEKADVFAFASILFTIVVSHRPFRETGERRGHSSSVMHFKHSFRISFLG
jgi:hypothetical protein